MNLYRWPRIAGWLSRTIARFNGGTQPRAVTLGGTTIYFFAPDERTRDHEDMHVFQAARRCPSAVDRWPLRLRAWLGAPWFWIAYAREHRRTGYYLNPFEVEARAYADARAAARLKAPT